MKSSLDYDGKNLHLKIELPPSEAKNLFKKILDIFLGASKPEENNKGKGSQKGGRGGHKGGA